MAQTSKLNEGAWVLYIVSSLLRSPSRTAPTTTTMKGVLLPLLLAAALVVVPRGIQNNVLPPRWSHNPSGVCEALLVGPPLHSPIRGRRSASHTGAAWLWKTDASSPSSSSSAASGSTALLWLSRDAALNELRVGAEAFRRGDVEASLVHFDKVAAQRPELRPYLWQRGISLYYANRFSDASDQFQWDVQVNPNDVEEIVWDMAAQARLHPEIYPPPNAMAVADLSRDKRRIMVRSVRAGEVVVVVRVVLPDKRAFALPLMLFDPPGHWIAPYNGPHHAQPTVYKLFKGQASEQELFVAGHGIGRYVVLREVCIFFIFGAQGSGVPRTYNIIAHLFRFSVSLRLLDTAMIKR